MGGDSVPFGIVPGSHTRLHRRVRRSSNSRATYDSTRHAPAVINKASSDRKPIKTKTTTTTIEFYVNDKEISLPVDTLDPELSLAEFLRYKLKLTGTKIGCGEGGCGACTVQIERRILYTSLSLSLSFKQTLNSYNDDPHSGTPGMVMSIYALLSKNSTPSKEDVEQFCQGNICRCTGYASIYKAARAAVSSSSKTMKNASTASTTTRKKLHARMPRKSIIKNNDSTTTYVNAVTLDDVFQILESYGPAESSSSLRLVVGNTSKGVVKYYSPQNSDKPSMFCDISRIPELLNINTDSSGITFGAAVTLTNMISSLEKLVSKGGMYTKRGSGPYSSMPNFIRHLKLVAHPQVRDVSSWTGNMMLAKAHPNFPSDVVVVLIAANASLTLLDSKGVCVCVCVYPSLPLLLLYLT